MEQLTSNNKFTFHGEDTGLSVVDFWSWAYSDLLNNTDRGVLAEYIVCSALLPPPIRKCELIGSPMWAACFYFTTSVSLHCGFFYLL